MQIVLLSVSQVWKLQLKRYLDTVINLGNEINHRTAIALRLLGPASFWSVARDTQTALVEAGFAVYPSTARAANAIVKFIEYHQRRKMLNEERD